MKKHKYKDNLTAFTFLLPTNVIFITLVVVPILFSAFLSFTDWNFLSGLSGIKWVGLSNFKKLLADRTFVQAVGVCDTLLNCLTFKLGEYNADI